MLLGPSLILSFVSSVLLSSQLVFLLGFAISFSLLPVNSFLVVHLQCFRTERLLGIYNYLQFITVRVV